jgi:hypothetical protein
VGSVTARVERLGTHIVRLADELWLDPHNLTLYERVATALDRLDAIAARIDDPQLWTSLGFAQQAVDRVVMRHGTKMRRPAT